MGYKILRPILRFILFFIFRIKLYGKENLLSEGGAVIAINHRSNWDAVVLSAVSPRPLGFMAKAELFKNRICAWFLRSMGTFPVQRGKGDLGAIKAALTRLRNGDTVAMFPEGTRNKEENEIQAKPGAVLLASRANVPIIPVRIKGNYRWLSEISVTVGKPIVCNMGDEKKLTTEQMQEITDRLMETIRAL